MLLILLGFLNIVFGQTSTHLHIKEIHGRFESVPVELGVLGPWADIDNFELRGCNFILEGAIRDPFYRNPSDSARYFSSYRVYRGRVIDTRGIKQFYFQRIKYYRNTSRDGSFYIEDVYTKDLVIMFFLKDEKRGFALRLLDFQ